MRTITVSTIVAVAMLCGVAEARLLWPTAPKGVSIRKTESDIEKLPTPKGFEITPAQVSQIFRPRKHRIMIYASGTHYFVTYYSRNQTYKKAQMFGTRINGKTGEIRPYSAKRKVVKEKQRDKE